jgi:hypothetical protein
MGMVVVMYLGIGGPAQVLDSDFQVEISGFHFFGGCLSECFSQLYGLEDL